MSFLRNIKKSTRAILFFAVGLNILGVVVYGGLYIFVNNALAEVGTLSGELQKYTIAQEMEKNERHVIADTEQDRNQLARYFISQDSSVSFIEDVEQLAQQTGVSLRIASVNVQEGELEIQVATSGSWQSTYHFLALVESMPMQIRMDQTSLVSGGDNTWNGTFALSVESFVE